MWGQTYGYTEWNEAFALVETSDGGYALAGYTSTQNNFEDFWLVKTDMHGNMEWNQTYGKSELHFECATSLVQASDGGYALAGLTAFADEDTDVWLVKTDAYGNVEWNTTYGGAQNDAAYSLVEAPDGGYVIAGVCNCPLDSMWDFWPSMDHVAFFNGGGYGWLVKVDASGNMEWNMTYGNLDDKRASFYSVVATSDGGYALTGRNNDVDGWLVKVDADGNIEWEKPYVGAGWSTFYSLVEASDGGYVLAGCHGNGNFWLAKTDVLGNMEWNQTYGGKGDDWAFSVVEASDGGYVMAGIWDFYDNSLIGYIEHTGSFWIVKTDEYGVMEWNHTYGGLGEYDFDWAFSLVATSDGGYAVAGTTAHSHFNRYFWLIKTDEYGVAPVVPEATWVIIPILVTATLAILISKKKLRRKNSEEARFLCGS